MHVILVDFILLALLPFYPIPVELPKLSGWLVLEALSYECCYSSCRCHCLGHRLKRISPVNLCWPAPLMVLWPESAGSSVCLCLGVIPSCRPLCCPVFMGHGKIPGEIHSDVPHGLRSSGSVTFYPTSRSYFRIV